MSALRSNEGSYLQLWVLALAVRSWHGVHAEEIKQFHGTLLIEGNPQTLKFKLLRFFNKSAPHSHRCTTFAMILSEVEKFILRNASS